MLSSLTVGTVERLGTADGDDDDDVVGGAMIAEDAVAEDAGPGAIVDIATLIEVSICVHVDNSRERNRRR